MYRKIFTFDLDGVLVDSSHRYRNKPDGTIDLDYWFANRTPEKIAKDRLLPRSMLFKLAALNSSIYTIICTSRVEHPVDRQFIADNLGMPDLLLMRPEGDMRGDAKLKREQLSKIFTLPQFKDATRWLWEDNHVNIEALSDMFDRCIYVPSGQGA